MTALLQAELQRLAWLLVAFLLPGWLLHASGPALVLALGLYLAQHLRSLNRLHRWLKAGPGEPPPELAGVWEDIADSIYRVQRNEQAARNNLLAIIARARASVSALEEAVVMTDGNGNLDWWNRAAERLLGFKEDIDTGKPIINLIRDPVFIRYFERGQQGEGLQLPSWTQPGRFLQLEVTRFGRNDRLLIAYDITRLRQLEQIRTDFVANVSHELRTPLTVLSGYLETLTDSDDLDARWQRAFRQMRQQTLRMNNLVTDLLLLSRLESDAVKPTPIPVDLGRLLEQLRQEALAFDPEKEQRVVIHIDSPLGILGVESDLRSAFSNLITNAVKYTPARGDIVVRWRADDRQGYLSVQDNGIGIEPRHLPRLTERFYRVDAGRSAATGGTGLGLAIVKHVLLQHQATLDIQSRPNAGSTFTCVFPRDRLVTIPGGGPA